MDIVMDYGTIVENGIFNIICFLIGLMALQVYHLNVLLCMQV